MRLFDKCFASKRIKRWRNAICQTTTKLGDARDRDVQIDLLCGTLSALNAKECFPGIARILVELECQREALQRKVVKAVDRLEAKGVLRDMRCATRKLLRDVSSQPDDVRTPAAFDHTQRHIVRQLEELLRHQESLADPEDRQSHHAMRIAAKRLRYTLEIARPVYPGRLDEAVEAIKKVQSLLGDVHDCDVWEEHLVAFVAKQRDRVMALFGNAGRLIRLQAGIEHLRADRRRYRQEVFRQLVDYWRELGHRQFWEGLKALVQAQGQLPAAVQPPEPGLPASSPAEAATRRATATATPTTPPDKALLTTGS